MIIPTPSTKPNTRSSRRWSPSAGRFDMPRSRTIAVRRRPRESPLKGAASDTLTEQAYRLIEEQIVTLALKPGDVLSEQLLSATLKIGRTPIREALQRLAREGLVTILPRKGILVADVNPRSQLLLLEVRREVERLLCRVAAERGTPEQRRQMQGLADGMDQAAKPGDDVVFMRLDLDLNRLLVEAAHNDFATRTMKLLSGLSRRFWYMHYRVAGDLPLCARLPANAARAIAKGAAAAAGRARAT